MYSERVFVRDVHINLIVLVIHMNVPMLQVISSFFLLLLGRFKPTTCLLPSTVSNCVDAGVRLHNSCASLTSAGQ